MTIANPGPGSVLLYLIVDDVLAQGGFQRFSLGYGNEVYKQHFSNRSTPIATMVLFRKTLRNRLRRASHRSFWGSVNLVRKGGGRLAQVLRSSWRADSTSDRDDAMS
jgi:CelD/BcsL family acetyltransferase involved in cellulose biosynthesis